MSVTMAEVNRCATCKHLRTDPQYCVKVFRPIQRPTREGCAGWAARVSGVGSNEGSDG